MTGHDLVVAARRVVTGGAIVPARVGVRDGVIRAVVPWEHELPATETVTLPDDDVLLPGLVDTHVHVNEPGRTEWEGFATATRAAAAGGVTTLVDMPLNSLPPTATAAALRRKRAAAARQGARRRRLLGRRGARQPRRPARRCTTPGVFGFKCFLSTPACRSSRRSTRPQLAPALAEIAGFDGAADRARRGPGAIAAGAARGRPTYADFLASRPPAAEDTAIARPDRRGPASTGARVHVLHLSRRRRAAADRAAARATGSGSPSRPARTT